MCNKKITTLINISFFLIFFTLYNTTVIASPYVKNVAGTGIHGHSYYQFNLPSGIFYNNGNIYVADTFNNLIRKVDLSSISNENVRATMVAGSVPPTIGFSDGINSYATFNRPYSIIYRGGRFYISDSENNAIRIIYDNIVTTLNATFIYDSLNYYSNFNSFNHPTAMVKSSLGYIFVADTLNHVIRVITPQNNVITIAGTVGVYGYNNGTSYNAKFNNPMGLALNEQTQRLYVADTLNNLIRAINLNENIVETVAGQLVLPNQMQWYTYEEDEWDNVPIGDFYDGYANEAMFNNPMGLAFLGNYLLVADSSNHRIRLVNSNGYTSTLVGTGEAGHVNGTYEVAQFHFPQYITVYNNVIFISDSGNNMIRKVLIQ